MKWNYNKAIITNTKWDPFFLQESKKKYFQNIFTFLNQNSHHHIFPSPQDLFNAFKLTPPDQVKVVILGQDPYHQPCQAHGLAFSVLKGTPLPPSLQNIFQELSDDLQVNHKFFSGDLTSWAKQGVLLLNTVLTVFANQAHSHKNIGWEIFTNEVIKFLDQSNQPIFILWGKAAQQKITLIKHSPIIKSAHPSPLSAHWGFWKSQPFSKTNILLKKQKKEIINWTRLD